MRYLVLLIKILCYLSLAIVLAGVVAAVIVAQTGGCPRFDEAAVQCISPFYENLGYFALTILLSSFLIGLPAIAGLAFLIHDFVRWRRARA
jgi:hypothetical protein